MRGITRGLVSIGIAAAVVGGATAAFAAEVVVESTRLTHEHRTTISKAGIEVLGEIRTARAAIAERNVGMARRHTARAQSLVEQARWGSPTTRLRDRLTAALHTLRTTGSLDAKQDLQPIYSELDATEIDVDKEVREYVAQSEAAGKKGKVEEADAALVEAAAKINYLEIDLPLNEMDHALSRAFFALQHRDLGSADTYLRAAQDQVRIVIAHAAVDVGKGEIVIKGGR